MIPLFDHNLSYRLPRLLADVFPGGEHVSRFGLAQADGLTIRAFAAADGFAVVSKDQDHWELATATGSGIELLRRVGDTLVPVAKRADKPPHAFAGPVAVSADGKRAACGCGTAAGLP